MKKEKFEIIPGQYPHAALTDVMLNESPRCMLLISDMNANEVYEGETEDRCELLSTEVRRDNKKSKTSAENY